MRTAKLLVVALALVALARSARAEDSWTAPFAGVQHLHRVTSTQDIHALKADLCSPGVSVRTTAYEERGQVVSSFANSVGAQAAVNAGFFSSGFNAIGLAAHQGALWPGTADSTATSPVAFGKNRAEVFAQPDTTPAAPWMQEVVSGQTLLVWNGQSAVPSPGGPEGRDPRTAVGLSQDRRTLVLVVVDGRKPNKIGMDFYELSGLLLELGAYSAINLDGGGSSTFYLQGPGVLNTPSDGAERVVANHLAIYASGSGPAAHCPIAGTTPAQLSGNDSLAAVNWTNSGSWPQDGHPEVFALKTTGQIDHFYAIGNTDEWSPAAALDKGAECGFAAGFWPAPKSYPEVFAPTTGDTTKHLWFTPPEWNTFQDYGGKGQGFSHLSSLVWNDGRVEVFALAADRHLKHRFWKDSLSNWSAWEDLGGKLASGASAILWGAGHAELFARDASGNPWHNWSGDFASGWHGWEKLQGAIASKPIPVRWPDGHLDVFATGLDGQLYRTAFLNNQWYPFVVESAGVLIEGEPSVAMNPEGAGTPAGPEVVVRSQQGKVLHLWWTGSGYSKLEPLGDQKSASDPFAWLREDGTLEVFAIEPKGNLRHTRRSLDKTWGKWTTLGSGYAPCTSVKSTPPEPSGTDAGSAEAALAEAGQAPDAPAAVDARPDKTREPTLAQGEKEHYDSLGQPSSTAGGCSWTRETGTGLDALLVSLTVGLGVLARRRRERPTSQGNPA